MPTYEKVVDGQVVETVTPVEGDHEDTRLGCAVLDGTDGWRVAGAETPAEPRQENVDADSTPAPEPTTPAQPDDTTEADDGTDPAPRGNPPAGRRNRPDRR